jgi:hypothetical protein
LASLGIDFSNLASYALFAVPNELVQLKLNPIANSQKRIAKMAIPDVEKHVAVLIVGHDEAEAFGAHAFDNAGLHHIASECCGGAGACMSKQPGAAAGHPPAVILRMAPPEIMIESPLPAVARPDPQAAGQSPAALDQRMKGLWLAPGFRAAPVAARVNEIGIALRRS